MMLPDNITSFYFLGIGGIGMSALARWFSHHRFSVAGYDRNRSAITSELEKEGIPVHYTDLGEKVKECTGKPGNTMVVYTPALPADHGELQWLKKEGFLIRKRSEILGMICNPARTIAVAGTHGKTTVSTMAATILSMSPQGCGAILGGISRNFGSNLLLPPPQSEWIVTEADEYDRSFLQLTPEIAIITYMEADHLDIYGSLENLKSSFLEFASGIKENGILITRKELTSVFQLSENQKVYSYSLSEKADFYTRDLSLDPMTRCYSFRIVTPEGVTPVITMSYPGIHNVENGVAAAAAAFLAGISPEDIRKGLEAYSGVSRRFDIRFRSNRQVYIDDYAHHPHELQAFITAVRKMWPDSQITGIFQPHLYSRTRDFAAEFAQSLDLLDTALVIPVYPAREQPIPGVSAELIVSKMKLQDKHLAEKGEIIPFLNNHPPEILLTMGAGDIELMSDELIEFLGNEKEN